MRPEDVFTEYFHDILDHTDIKMNIFIIGYKQDQGVRACGGRSGSELGPENFRQIINSNGYHDLASRLRESGAKIYDLGDIGHYLLSIYAKQKPVK
jgi:arginase family enzyme